MMRVNPTRAGRIIFSLGVCLLLAGPSKVLAQAGEKVLSLEDIAKTAFGSVLDEKEAVRELLSAHHELRPRDIDRLFNSKSASFSGQTLLSGLLTGLNLEPVLLDTRESDGQTVLGLAYAYERQVSKEYSNSNSANYYGIGLDLKANGTLTSTASENPENFQNVELSFLHFFSRGGVAKTSDPGVLNLLDDLEQFMAGIDDPNQLAASEEAQAFDERMMGALSDQYYLEIAGHGGFDADQQFDSFQRYAGGHIVFAPRGWNVNSVLSMINVLDYVPALFRVLTDVEQEWTPRGSALPTFIAAIDQVYPGSDNPRSQLDNDEDFTRFRFEMAFRTEFGEFLGGTTFLETNIRYYCELDASNAVKSAGLDEFGYFTSALIFPNNVYLSYTAGQLPFDRQDDQVYKVGFRYSF